MTVSRVFSCWLIPCTEDGSAYSRIISHFAQTQGRAEFAPHLSLGSLTELDETIDGTLSSLAGLTLQPTRIGRSDLFTQSLFVELEPNAALREARAYLEARPSFHSSRTFAPHISLCYGPTENERDVEAEMHDLLQRSVTFDRLQIVEVSLPVTTQQQVAAWTPLRTYRY